MTQDLFNDPQVDQPQIDETKNYLEELVGEGKKFKDHEALAKGKAFADAMIEFKNKETDKLRTDYLALKAEHDAAKSVKELLDQYAAGQSGDNRERTPNADDDRATIDMSKIEELVLSKIQETEITKKQRNNFNSVMDTMKQRHGNQWQAVLKQRTDELGLDTRLVNDLANNAPKAFFKTLGFDEQDSKETFTAPPQSNRRSDNFAPKTVKRDWNYYEKIRKGDPGLYYDPKTQVQMHRDLQEVGPKAFYGE